MEPNATIARCPRCGQEILISNPREGKIIVCGNCHSELKLHREHEKRGKSGSSPILGYAASFFAGAFFGPFLTAWLWAQVLKRAKAI